MQDILVEIHTQNDHGDLVRCTNCCSNMLVDVGAESCPKCNKHGALAWLDDETKEADVDALQRSALRLLKMNRLLAIPPTGIRDVSDGTHTFNDLYHQRTVLFAALCSLFPQQAWKSHFHSDGSKWDGFFICGITTPQGEASYHCKDKYWEHFQCKQLGRAPKWDGYTPDEALERIYTFATQRGKQ